MARRSEQKPLQPPQDLVIQGGPPHITEGSMLVFYDQLVEPMLSEFCSRMIGEDWTEFGDYEHIKRFRFKSLGRLERALELLCVGLGPAELSIVRAAVIRDGPDEIGLLLEAAQSMEYLAEVLQRIRASWLRSLLEVPQHFFNVFQPMIDLSSGRVFAYEMLIRAHSDKQGGIIGGGQLAEAALASKQIYVFDLLAREVAIRTAAKKFPEQARIFINFMPNSVLDPQRSLDKTLYDCKVCNIPPERVVFEVVESESIADIAYLKKLLNNYRQRGFKIALDDLGSGYSGLNYMLELMPDFVKLDRDLVNGCATNSSKRVIVSKIIEAAHDIGIQVIAEGIETFEDFRAVQELGANIVQGYYFAKPSAEMIFAEDYNLLDAILGQSKVKAED